MNTMTPWAAAQATAGRGAAADLGRVTTARESTRESTRETIRETAREAARETASDSARQVQSERALRADRDADTARETRRGFSEAMAQQRRTVSEDRDSDAARGAARTQTQETSPSGSDAPEASSSQTEQAPTQAALAIPPSDADQNAQASLAQAVAALLDGTAPASSAVPALADTLATDGTGAAAQSAADARSDAADAAQDASSNAALPAWLVPTLLPTVMPPPPALGLAAAAFLNGQGTAASGTPAAGNIEPATAASSLLSGAVAADAAQLLSLKAQTAHERLGNTSAIRAAADAPTSTDASAWAGLQRWSAAMMDASSNALAPAPAGTVTDHSLTLPDQRQDWRNSLMQALGDRLQLQAVQRSEQARLHLMPPQLGRIEIDIRQQGGALQVQLSATHDDVRQQLRQIAEPLRQDLVQRHTGDVSVQVASGAQAAADGRGREGAAGGQAGQGQAGQGQPRDAQRQPGRALTDDARSAAGAFGDALAGQAQAQV